MTDFKTYGIYSNPALNVSLTEDRKIVIAFTDQTMTALQIALYFKATESCTEENLMKTLNMIPSMLPTVTTELVIVTAVSDRKNSVGATCTKNSECITTNCVETEKKDEIDETPISECSNLAKFGTKR
eukprot:UN03163